ncbi:T-complex protein 11-domain-containing protein [Lyophyllum atratum]|nr:T-complex protein 11-domain-containing protein [Lyophyllum atratum]
MDHLAHDFAVNHRKRKADDDDSQDGPATDNPVVTPLVDAPSDAPDTAPRQPWLASRTEWPAPPSPQVSSPLSGEVMFNTYPPNPTKRPRLEKIETSLRITRRLTSRKSAVRATPSRPPPTTRHGSDIEDLGMVSAADPGPSSGSLLHLRPGPKSADPLSPSVGPFFPIDTNSIHIPSLQPLVNRQTLKELDLDVILRNPQLRHDLLFDPGLQFRPTCSRRKRGMCERYWAALIQEVESGCTCVSFDSYGKPHTVVCACVQVPKPPSHPVVAYSSALNVLTLRMPSRIRNLLAEFLEVLLLVIQPLSSISGMYVNPNTFKSQMQEHSAQAAYIRSIFDPALIEQELKHELFDPSGLFSAIGGILKGHCAPMRDRAVEAMVQAAQACAPGGTGSKSDAVSAVRMCLEILELMKLDIANHQLQTLRPFLMRTYSLQLTREWLRSAHSDLLARGPISHPRHTSQVLKGTLDLVFDPPPSSPSASTASSSSPPPTPIFQSATSSSSRLQGPPETAYLDNNRLALLSADAADTTALYMFLLLYRQLVHSESGDSPPASPQDLSKVDDANLLRLKSEIRDIGSSRLGYCFSSRIGIEEVDSAREKELEKERSAKQDIVLQVAKRAKDARSPTTSSPLSSQPSSPVGEAPDEHMLSLAQRWADSNIHPDSPLCSMLRRRLRDVVFNSVIAQAYPGRDSKTGKLATIDFACVHMQSAQQIPSARPRISRLALIHLNAYLPLYEQDGFLA